MIESNKIVANILLLGGSQSTVEFIDIESKISCLGPQTLTWSKGGRISKSITISCGRFGSNCISLDIDTLETKTIPVSFDARYAFAVIPIIPFGENEQKLWLTGGVVGGTAKKSTELIDIKGSTPGPDLPNGLKNHCIVRINSTSLLLSGHTGYFYYHMTSISGQWKPGPDSIAMKSYRSCGTFEFMGKAYAAFVGGNEAKSEFVDPHTNTLIIGNMLCLIK